MDEGTSEGTVCVGGGNGSAGKLVLALADIASHHGVSGFACFADMT